MKKPHEPHRAALKTDKDSTFDKNFYGDFNSNSNANSNGITVTSDELYRLQGDALRVLCSPDAMVSSLFPGAYKALFHGRGLEFDEVRKYQWGDDYRLIDWRVTARTGQMYTKLFHEERERTLYLLVDGSEAMHFGTRKQFKWVLAARIAAIFAWLAYERGDRVAALVVGDSVRCRFQPPGMGERALVRIFHLLAQEPQLKNKELQPGYKESQPGYKEPQPEKEPQPGNKKPVHSRLVDGMKYLRQVARKDALILILSDFRQPEQETRQQFRQQLGYLAHHFEVAAIKLYDPLEMNLPSSGRFPITNGKQKMLLNTGQNKVAESYKQRFNDEHQSLIKLFRQNGIRLHSMGTQQDLLDGLRNITMKLKAMS